MASPLGKMPTLEEFIQEVSAKYQVQRGTLTAGLTGPRGLTQVEYLTRAVNGRTLTVPIPNIPLQQHLTPTPLRNLCQRLQIPLADYGLLLDDFDVSFGYYKNGH